jgi:S1-C subfamily serine protease
MLAPILSACGTEVVPQPVETRQPIPVTGPESVKLQFSGIRYALQASDTVIYDEGGVLPGGFVSICDGLGGEMGFLDARISTNSGILLDNWTREFRDRLETAGYDLVGDNDSFYREPYESLEARYRIGALVTDMDVVACPRSLPTRRAWFRGLLLTGEASITVRWEVMDDLEQRVVLRTTTRGYARDTQFNNRIAARVLRRAFGSAAANLGADPRFWRLATSGAVPPPRLVSDPTSTLPPRPTGAEASDPAPRLVAGAPGPAAGPPIADFSALARSTAVVRNSGGHGSAFLIDPAGLLLTNAHVAGVRGQVSVEFFEGPRRIATVVAADRRRDVALLAIDPVEGLAALPIRLDRVRVGDPVAAIGTPLLDYLTGTVSRGTVSALRQFDFPAFGDQTYIQADTPIIGGNSGGPLVDDRGNVVGIAVAGFNDPLGGNTHLNLFIPIAEALRVLGLTLPHGDPAPLQAAAPVGAR